MKLLLRPFVLCVLLHQFTFSNAQQNGSVILNADNDATVRSNQANSNFGSANQIKAERQAGNQKQFYIDFPFGDLMSSVQVIEAKLVLTPQQTQGNNSAMLAPVNSDWDENTITWSNKPSVNMSQTINLPSITGSQTDTIDVSTHISGMLDGTFHGWCLRLSQTNGTHKRNYYSDEHGAVAFRPQLILKVEMGGMSILSPIEEFGALAKKKVFINGTPRALGDIGAQQSIVGSVSVGPARTVYPASDPVVDQALQDAKDIHKFLMKLDASSQLPITGPEVIISPDIYNVNGNVILQNKYVLDGEPEDLYVIQVDGDVTFAPGFELFAEHLSFHNVIWVVKGDVLIQDGAIVHGLILAKGDIEAEPSALGLLALISTGKNVTFSAHPARRYSVINSVEGIRTVNQTDIQTLKHFFDDTYATEPNLEPFFDLQNTNVTELAKKFDQNPASGQVKQLNIATDPLIIPVVVHVVYDPAFPQTNISDAQILSQIDALNAAFNEDYPSYNGQAHGPFSDNSMISFCLATNPSPSSIVWPGQPGVLRYADTTATRHLTYTDGTTHIEANALHAFTHPTPNHFPASDYLNIWVVSGCDGANFIPPNQAPGQIIGYAPLPLLLAQGVWNLDGIVCRYDAFGDNSTGNTFDLIPNSTTLVQNAILDEGKTMVHEVGHYLNLFHTFEPNDGNCHGTGNSNCDVEGDLVCDTPPAKFFGAHNCINPGGNTCLDTLAAFGNNQQNDMVENHMAYSYDPCKNTFTQGQNTRMRAWIAFARSNLVSYSNLQATDPFGCSPIVIAEFEHNASCTDSLVTFSTYTGNVFLANDWTWDFGDGSPIQNTTIDSITHTYTAPGIYNVILIATDGITTATDTVPILIQDCLPYQGPDANWHFGFEVNLDFSNGAPQAGTNSAMDAQEGCLSVSDSLGNLLFYTNGDQVYDQNDLQINPVSLFNSFAGPIAGNSSSQMAYVPVPGSPNQYYIVHHDGVSWPNSLPFYSIVNITGTQASMTAANSNIPLAVPPTVTGTGERVVVVPHCNGKDYWLILGTHDTLQGPFSNTQELLVYLVTDQGFKNPDAISNVPAIINTGVDLRSIPAEIKASPDGTKLAVVATVGPNDIRVVVWDFDNASGTISNAQTYPTTMNNTTWAHGITFSPNSQAVYYTNGQAGVEIMGVDLSTGTQTLVTNVINGQKRLEIGPDGNIYVGQTNGLIDYVSVIAGPNNPATATFLLDNVHCDPDTIPQRYVSWNLPSFINASKPPLQTPEITSTPVSCGTFQFSISSCFDTITYNYEWDFEGDAVIDDFTQSPTHTYPADGQYIVTLNLYQGNNLVGVFTDTLNVDITPNEMIVGTDTTCVGAQFVSYSLPFGLGSYDWIAIHPNGDTTVSSVSNITPNWSSPGTGIVIVDYTTIDGCVGSDTLAVAILGLGLSTTSTFDLGGNCIGTATVDVTGTVGIPPYDYTWDDPLQQGANNTTNLSDTAVNLCAGTYIILVQDGQGCTDMDTIQVLDFECAAPSNTFIPSSGSTVSSGLWGVGFFNEPKVHFDGDFLVDGNFTISDCPLVSVAPGVQITVAPGATLTIERSYLYGCDSLWQGILVDLQGHLILDEDTIQDAEIAVESVDNNDPFTITRTIFNKNHKHIFVPGPGAPFFGTIEDRTQFLCEEIDPLLSPGATLKPPRAGEITDIAVHYLSVDTAVIGMPTSGAENIFRNANVGIAVTRATVLIQNNHFEQMDGDFVSQDPNVAPIGTSHPRTGVWALMNLNIHKNLHVGGDGKSNSFSDLSRGVYAIDCHKTVIDSNFFDQIIPFTSSQVPQNAIKVLHDDVPGDDVDVRIRQNVVTDHVFGIAFEDLRTGPVFDCDVEIDSNSISDNLFVTSTGVLVESIGIVHSQMAHWRVFNNDIQNVTTGVHAVGTGEPFLNINANNIQLKNNIQAPVPNAGIRIEGGHTVIVIENDITGGAGAISDTIAKGIYSTLSPINFTRCNRIGNTGRAFQYEGNMVLSEIERNHIADAYDGFTLINGGMIGQQGGPGGPSDNRWTGVFNNSMMQTRSNSDGGFSPFYVRQNPLYNPQMAGSNIAVNNSFPVPFFNTTGPIPVDSCLPIVPGDTFQLDNGGQQLLLTISGGFAIYSAYDSTNRFVGRALAYRILRENPDMRTNNQSLDSLYSVLDTSTTGQFGRVEENLLAGNVLNAEAENSLITPSDMVEENCQTANICYFRHRNDTFTAADVQVLFEIAQQCPMEGGPATYLARTLLNAREDNLYEYDLSCGTSHHFIAFEDNAKSGFDFDIYPNPNQGDFTVKYSLEESAVLSIYDASGSKVGEQQLNAGNSVVRYNNRLSAGIYLVRITTWSGQTDTRRIVVTQ